MKGLDLYGKDHHKTIITDDPHTSGRRHTYLLPHTNASGRSSSGDLRYRGKCGGHQSYESRDEPRQIAPEQYALYLGGLVHGDFGYSYSYRQDVLPLITSRIPNTLTLTLTALLFAFIIGTSVGIIAALKQNTIFDYIVMVITLVGVSMPIFWLALMLVLQFSVKMNLLPVMGMGDLSKGFGDVVIHMILPGFCLATIDPDGNLCENHAFQHDRYHEQRLHPMSQSPWNQKLKVILIHGLKNALPPLITVLGLQIAGTFTGAIITEGIFSWPGMGTMINTAINNRDYSLIQGAVLFSAIMFVFCNMLVDIAYAILNPKVKLEKG